MSASTTRPRIGADTTTSGIDAAAGLLARYGPPLRCDLHPPMTDSRRL